MEITYTERNGIFYPDLALPIECSYYINNTDHKIKMTCKKVLKALRFPIPF